ncbi:hypothetical protein [Gryllotalpicola koreensis]|uniref:YqaJ viral recombinase domain-containing protein n=1 Tax=Gryllotalpicola koreensis TaxID=993086 RepID=A0ABP8A2N2_9MICO
MPDWRDRIINPGDDRLAWEAARRGIVGASDVAHYARASSIDKYVAAKLREDHFGGNERTELGHRFEPMMLAYAGIPQNTALIAHPVIEGIAATPDGILEDPDGRVVLAECKARVGRIADGPSTAEWRQLATQFEVMPEAIRTHFLWCTLIKQDGEWVIRGSDIHELIIPRDHPRIIAARDQSFPLAIEVSARLQVALEFKEALTA